MPVVVIFSCEICGARPDPETQLALERQMLDLRHGEYVDAEPGRWLTWHGRGIYGRTATPAASIAASSKRSCASITAGSAGTPGRSARTPGPVAAAPTARGGSPAHAIDAGTARVVVRTDSPIARPLHPPRAGERMRTGPRGRASAARGASLRSDGGPASERAA